MNSDGSFMPLQIANTSHLRKFTDFTIFPFMIDLFLCIVVNLKISHKSINKT